MENINTTSSIHSTQFIIVDKMAFLKNYRANLNVFAPPPNSNEQETNQQRRWNIIATRFYILLLTLILFWIGLGLSLITHTMTITIDHPTKEQFERLPNVTRKSIGSHISIPYKNFTSLQVSFHQICASSFVSDRWINTVNLPDNMTYLLLGNFRRYGSAQFEAIAGFCRSCLRVCSPVSNRSWEVNEFRT